MTVCSLPFPRSFGGSLLTESQLILSCNGGEFALRQSVDAASPRTSRRESTCSYRGRWRVKSGEKSHAYLECCSPKQGSYSGIAGCVDQPRHMQAPPSLAWSFGLFGHNGTVYTQGISWIGGKQDCTVLAAIDRSRKNGKGAMEWID